MNVTATVESPNEVKITLRVTLTYREWMKLHSQLVGGGADYNYVADDLAREVRDVLGKVSQTFAADLASQK